MSTLAFDIMPSPSSNDHQARIRIDGTDWLGQEYLGLDPSRLFGQPALTTGGKLLVGRCECGCEGCDDVLVDVLRQGQEVLWTNAKGLKLHFDSEEYDTVVASAREDFSWEDTERTAERLVSAVFIGVVLDGGYAFDWASARIRDGLMTLSFSKGGTQKLFEFAWDGQSPQDALAGARRFNKDRVEPGAPSNGGPALRSANSEAGGGPPSVG
jgi:hypothetical protein